MSQAHFSFFVCRNQFLRSQNIGYLFDLKQSKSNPFMFCLFFRISSNQHGEPVDECLDKKTLFTRIRDSNDAIKSIYMIINNSKSYFFFVCNN